MKHVCISLAAALALAVPSLAQSAEETPFSCEVRTTYNQPGTSYSSLAEAVAAVPADGTLRYVYVIGEGPAKITTPITVKAGQNISLYSEKSGITYDIPASLTAPVFTVESGARLTFTKNGKYVYGEGVQGTFLENYGYVSIANGTFTLDAGDSGAAFINHGGTEDNSMKCSATVSVASGTAFRNDGVLTISSGTTTAESGIAVLSNGGTLTLSTSKSVIGSEGAIVVNGGVAKFEKGTLSSTGSAPAVLLCASNAPIDASFKYTSLSLTSTGGDALEIAGSAQVCKVQFNKGTFTPAEGKASIRVTHDTEDADITLSVVDGVFNAPIVSEGSAPVGGFILGGSFVASPDAALVADGLTFEQNADGLYAPTAVAQIGDAAYLTFKEAIAAATADDTVTLLRDVTIPESTPITVYGLTIDLAGHTLTNTAANGSGIRLTLSNAEGTPADFTLVGPGTVVAATPLYASGDYNYARPYTVIVDESVILTPTAEGNPQIELSGSARVAATDANVTRLGQGGFKVKDGDAEWLYGNCAGAFLNVPEGGTFTLCQDFKGSSRLEFPIDPTLLQTCATGIVKSATLDLAGHAFTSTLDGTSADLIVVDSGAAVTIKNGTLTASGDLAHVALPPDGGNAALTLEGITATSSSDDYLIVSNGSTDNIDITVRNSTLTATGKNTVAIYAPAGGDSTVTLDNAIIKSPYGVQVCAGNLVVKGNTQITTTAANVASTKTGDGPIPDGAAISIVNRAGYGNVGTVTIEGTPTLIAQGEGATAVAAYTWNDNTPYDWAEASEHVAISGGTFSEKPDNAWFADGFIPVENADGTFGVAPGSFAAEIAGVKYLTLKEAIAAVPANGAEATTITLLDDVTSAGSLPLTNGQKAILNMNGKTVTFSSGKLLTGEGSLVCQTPSTGAISIYGNETSQIDLLVDSAVTVNGHYGIALFGNGASACRNVTVTVKGTVKTSEGGSALYVNGTVNNTEGSVPQIILAEGATVEAASVGIHAAGYAKWNLAGTINADYAISIKCGDFTITGGSYTSTGNFVDPAEANSNGTEDTGAAISITTNPDYAQKTNVTITGGTFTSTNGYAFYEGIAVKDGQPIAEASTAVIAIQGGDFTGNADLGADIAITTAENKQVVSGGMFSQPVELGYCADGYIPTATTVGDVTTYGVKATDAVAVIAKGDGTYTECATIPQAVGFVPANVPTTIIILQDITNCGQTKIEKNKNVTIDLNGHNITFAKRTSDTTSSYPCFTVKPMGHLTLTGTGTVSEFEIDPYWTPICVNGSGASDAQYACSVTVDENVTLKGWSGIVIDPIAKTIKAAYNVSITVAGKIEADTYGIYVNGALSNATGPVPEITVTETADIDSKGDGIYAAGYAKWALAGDVAARTAIVVRSGELTFTGGTYTSTMLDAFEEVTIDHTGGAVGTGAALSISSAVGYGASTVDIQGGIFVSANGPAIYEYAAPTSAGDEAPASKVELAITNGDFTSGGDHSPLLLTAMNNTQVVSGGTFSQPVELAYCAPGYIPVFKDGKYTVDGTAVAAVANPAAQGAYLGYGTLDALIKATTDGTEVLIVKYEALGEEVNLLKTATGGDNAASGAAAYDVAETLGGTFKVQDGAIVYAYQLGIADLDVTESGISVTVRLEEGDAPVTRTLAGRKVRVVSDGKTLAEADAFFKEGACALTVPKADLPAGNLELTISVAPAAEAETPAE